MPVSATIAFTGRAFEIAAAHQRHLFGRGNVGHGFFRGFGARAGVAGARAHLSNVPQPYWSSVTLSRRNS